METIWVIEETRLPKKTEPIRTQKEGDSFKCPNCSSWVKITCHKDFGVEQSVPNVGLTCCKCGSVYSILQ